MKKQLGIVCALALASTTSIFAQQTQEKEFELDEVVISATKFKLEKKKIGKVIYKITQKEIENNAGRTVIELLNTVPGVEIKGTNSAAGSLKGTYVRGGRSRQVLVLIDGIPVSDPTGINQEYDLRMLSLNQIESIEVLKGASSTLYGSGAASGVINIILKKSAKDAIKGTYEASLGTNNSANSKSLRLQDKNQNASISGSIEGFSYLASINLTTVDGLSAAKSKTNASFDKDPFNTTNASFKLGYTVNKNIKVDAFYNFDEYDYGFDGGAYTDSDTREGDQKQVRIGIRPSFKYSKGNAYVIASLNKVNRALFGNTYEGKSLNVDAVNQYTFSHEFQLITGVTYQKHDNQTNSQFGNINKDVANYNTVDPYASIVYTSDFGLNVNVGGRLNSHSKYGNHTVYDINPSYNVYATSNSSLKVLTSFSTAFIAPSTYQLFSVYGNLDLEPETSETFEFGFESTYKKWLDFNAVFFNRTENKSIIFNSLPAAPWGKYGNSASNIKVKGIEADVVFRPFDNTVVNIGYTYVDKDAEAFYIPKNKLTANVQVSPFKNTFFSIDYKNVGERSGSYYDAAIFSSVVKVLPAYNLLDFNANYKVLEDTVTFFGSVTNVLNEDYEETLGFNTRGRNFKLGIRLQF